MSEKVYSWLLRLYPADFRKNYGADALQLFRDRSRDERGFFPKLRLWLDLLFDFAVYRHPQPVLARIAAHDGTPSFWLLERASLRPGTLLSAALLSLLAVGSVPALVARGGRPSPQTAISLKVESAQLDAAERRRVVDGAVANIKRYYDYPDVGLKVADALLAHEKNGDDDAVTDGASFADLLTVQMLDVSHDKRLKLRYYRDGTPTSLPGPHAPSPEDLARYREVLKKNNCFFEKVKILPHNIGYLRLDSFPDPSFCRPTAAAAMASLNSTDAIVFDLRENRGGYPEMVALIAGYLFDHPTHLNDMYDRAENSTAESWTARGPGPST